MRLNSADLPQPGQPGGHNRRRAHVRFGMVDVKLTETDLPWFLKAAQFVPFINAHARVSIVQAETISGALPVGVPDPRPARARVTFIDESTGEVLGERNLLRAGRRSGLRRSGTTRAIRSPHGRSPAHRRSRGPQQHEQRPLRLWRSPRGLLRLPVSRMALLHIRGWSGAGTVTPPTIRSRGTSGCSPAPAPVRTSRIRPPSASTGVDAQIDFGTAGPRRASSGARIVASLGGNKSYPLTYDPVTTRWRSNAVIPIAAGAGPVSINLALGEAERHVRWAHLHGEWQQHPVHREPSLGVQRIFAGSDLALRTDQKHARLRGHRPRA